MIHDNDNTYNGWKNYETWNINLWIQNDEGLYGFVRDSLAVLLDANGNDWENVSMHDIQEIVHDAFPLHKTPDGVSLFSNEIDWDEISDALLELAEGNNIRVRPDVPAPNQRDRERDELDAMISKNNERLDENGARIVL